MKKFLAITILGLSFSMTARAACLYGKNGAFICPTEQVSVLGVDGVIQDVNEETGIISVALDKQQLIAMQECRAEVPHTGNPHRDHDAKFRACGYKANQLQLSGDMRAACVAVCMKN